MRYGYGSFPFSDQNRNKLDKSSVKVVSMLLNEIDELRLRMTSQGSAYPLLPLQMDVTCTCNVPLLKRVGDRKFMFTKRLMKTLAIFNAFC